MIRSIFFLIILSLSALGYTQHFDTTSIPFQSKSTCTGDWQDYNNDNLSDFLYDGGIYNIQNNSFIEIDRYFDKEPDHSDSKWIDIDNDGDLDIIYAYTFEGRGYITVYKNNNHVFRNELYRSIFLLETRIAVGDLNNDGYNDIVASGLSFEYKPETNIYFNQKGEFDFYSPTKITDLFGGSIGITDMELDGDQDLLVSGFDKHFKFETELIANHNSNFQVVRKFDSQLEKNVLCYDYDADGYSDMLNLYIIREGNNQGGYEYTKNYLDKQTINPYGSEINRKLINTNKEYHGDNLLGVIDYDNNGSYELITTSGIYSTEFENTEVLFEINDNIGVNFISITDYDHDLIPDLMFFSNDTVLVLNSAVIFHNNAPSIPKETKQQINNNQVVLSWDQSSDDSCKSVDIQYIVELNGILGRYSQSIHLNSFQVGGNIYLKDSHLPVDCEKLLLKNLVPGEYTWRVRAMDNMGLLSDYSDPETFEILPSYSLIDLPLVSTNYIGNHDHYLYNALWGDIDNDDDLDLVLQNTVFRNNGNLQFEEIETKINYDYYHWTDIDKDGFIDLHGRVIYRNNEGNGFDSIGTGVGYGYIRHNSLVEFDFNADFKEDLFGQNNIYLKDTYGTDVYDEVYYINHSYYYDEERDAVFKEKSSRPRKLAIYDYDNDSDLDIVCEIDNDLNYNEIGIFELRTDDKAFSDELFRIKSFEEYFDRYQDTWVETNSSVFEVKDFNGDGSLDILCSGTLLGYGKTLLISDISGEVKKELLEDRSYIIYDYQHIDDDTYMDILAIDGYDRNNGIHSMIQKSGSYNFYDTLFQFTGGFVFSKADIDNDGINDFLTSRAYEVGTIPSYFQKGVDENPDFQLLKNNYKRTIKPEAPSGLKSTISDGKLLLNWNEPALGLPAGSNYNHTIISLSTGQEHIFSGSNLENGYRKIVQRGNLGITPSYQYNHLPDTGYYKWAVQVVDINLQGGPWSEFDTIYIPDGFVSCSGVNNCLGTTSEFSNNSSMVMDSIKWDFGDGNKMISTDHGSVEHFYVKPGDYNVVLTGIRNGYSYTDSTLITIYPMPELDFDYEVVSKGELTPIINTSKDTNNLATGWYWDFGDGKYSDQFNPEVHKYLEVGEYEVKLSVETVHGCHDTLSQKVAICESALIKPTVYVNGPVVNYLACSNDSVLFYRWYYNGELINGAHEYICIANQNYGLYFVEISNDGICFVPSEVVEVGHLTMVDKNDSESDLKIYPNPSEGKFRLSLFNNYYGEATIYVFNSLGSQILFERVDKKSGLFEYDLDLSTYSAGQYHVVLCHDKQEYREVIIIR